MSEPAPRPAVTVRRRRTASWLVLAATAAAIAIAVVARSSSPRSDTGADRIKGLRPALTLYRHAPLEVAPIVSAARAAPLSAALPRGLEHATFSLQKEATP